MLGVEARDVVEGGRVEVRAQLAVDHMEDVEVELRGDAARVVIRRLEDGPVLDQIGAEQQMVLAGEQPGDRAQEALAAGGGEVADRAAEKRQQPRPPRRGQPVEVALEVADQPVDAQPRILAGQLCRALAHDALGHVDRHVALERAGGGHRVEQQARLRRAPGTQLDELARAGVGDQLRGDAFEDRPLGARRVVLRQLADLIEQRRAARVVEMLRWQLPVRPRQAVANVLGERAAGVCVERVLDGSRS